MKLLPALSIKNGIIALLGLICAFLLAYSLGAFEQDSSGFFASYRTAAAVRDKAVGKGAVWKIAAPIPKASPIGREALHGIREAVNHINAQGGIAGKPIELLEVEGSTDFVKNKFLLQRLCEDPEIALYMGPWYTAELLPSRALAHFQAMPMVSLTLADHLPPLTPEIHASLLPPLRDLTMPLGRELIAVGAHRLLILSPEREYYGGRFASQLERDLDLTDFFWEVFRSNYVPQAEYKTLYKSLKFYRDNVNLDAIVFTGDDEEILMLGNVMSELNISVPVFCSDQIDISDYTENNPLIFPSDVYYIHVSGEGIFSEYHNGFASLQLNGSLWEQYGALAVFMFKDALDSRGYYSTETVTHDIREILDKRIYKEGVHVPVEIRKLPVRPVSR